MSRVSINVCRAFRGLAVTLYETGSCKGGNQLQPYAQPLVPLCRPWQPHDFSLSRAAASQPLVHLKQQHQQDQSSSSSNRPSWPKLAAAGAAAGAAAAAVGWAMWSDGAAAKRAQALAEQSNRAVESRASPRTQAALVSCYAGPLVTLLWGLSPSQTSLQTLAAAVTAESSLLNPWELVNSLWGLAMFGAQLNPNQLQTLTAAVISNMGRMTLYQAVVAAWAVTMLSGSSSSSSSFVWQQLLSRLQAAAVQEFEDAAVLYLLHASMQQAAAAASAASKESLGGACPRATEQQVLQQLSGASAAARAKVAAAYKEYVPFQHYIEGPYLLVLHIAKALPSQIHAAAAAGSSSSSSSSDDNMLSPYQAMFGSFSQAEAAGAVTVVSDRGLLSKLRRNLFYGWRAGQLLDRHQTSCNQIYYVLSRRLNIQEVQQQPDVDILLPTLKAAMFLTDDLGQPTPQLGSSSSSSSIQFTGQQQQQQPCAEAQYLQQCHEALTVLVRNHYAAPPGGFHAKNTAGITAAKHRCLEQLGWQVVVVRVSEVEACMGPVWAARATRNKAQDLEAESAALEALLRERLHI